MLTLLWILLILGSLTALAYCGAKLMVWTVTVAVGLVVVTFFSTFPVWVSLILWVLAAAIIVPLHLDDIRQRYFTRHVLRFFRKVMPAVSETEREAIAAGTVSWEGELFSGKPDWAKLQAYPKPQLTAEEQAFLDGPVEQLCSMIDDWDITHNRADLPAEMWQFIKEQGFFGMMIPKEYGGKGFSALAHSEVLVKVAGLSNTVASTITVPNSLGPGELLHCYGTQAQKDHYLPRLASGEDVPCFALTEPDAGSDAGAMRAEGIVCERVVDGEKVLGILLNFNKRYITLAPVATVLGLAFKLYDPDHLLGEKTNIGITCALIPVNTPGITTGRRHYPLNIVFQNGPVQGKDVFIPVDYIIGGQEQAGKGWRMLMENLADGRAVSLPSSATGGAKAAAAATGVYARVRKQFNIYVGQFEGVQEALARIAGYSYVMDAVRKFTVGLVLQGQKPAVPSAISKYHVTELGRKVIADAMDVHGGKGICMGPNNYLARGYQGAPIGITVEGANILTRCMIIFGQGAIRCHPFALKEMEAAALPDEKAALTAFDDALMGHLAYIMRNKARAFVLGLTNGYGATAPNGKTRRYYQQLSRFSAAFAFLADMAMLELGGSLKFRESISARLGDCLSMLYLGSAVLKRYEEEGQPAEDLPLVQWACQHVLYELQQSLDGVLQNFPNCCLALGMKVVIFPLGKRIKRPSDKLNGKVAKLLMSPNESRSRLLAGAYLTPNETNPVGQMQQALEKIIAIEPLEKKLRQAQKEGKIKARQLDDQIAEAGALEILTAAEVEQFQVAEQLRQRIIAVDDFAAEDLQHGSH